MTEPIKTGTRVRYSVRFLRSISAYAGVMPHASGVVKQVSVLGDTSIATITWDNNADQLPERVNVGNLCHENDPEHQYV